MTPPVAPAPPFRLANHRWRVCALVFFATTINYVDRLVFGILAPELQRIFQWTTKDYTDIVFWFEVAYAVGLVSAGGLLDRFGTRLGFAVALAFWSLAAVLHAGMATILGFKFARFLLGLGEAGNFPAAIKTVAEWFPKRERALATGIFNAGTNVGAVVAPLAVPWLYLTFGWQWAFIATGAIGLVWLAFWLPYYRPAAEHPGVSPAELAHIQSDPIEPAAKVSWWSLLRYRQTWAFVIAKFATDSIWRWYLYLLPLFFAQNFKLDIKSFGLPFVAIYTLADLGSIGGGWLSSHLMKRGWSVNAGRKTAMLVCAVCVTPVAFVTHLDNVWAGVLLVGLAAAAHQGWSANLFTTASDMFPKQAVASIVGLGGMAGAFGAMLILHVTGYVLSHGGGYGSLFLIAALAYLLSLGAFQLLAPRLEPADLREPAA